VVRRSQDVQLGSFLPTPAGVAAAFTIEAANRSLREFSKSDRRASGNSAAIPPGSGGAGLRFRGYRPPKVDSTRAHFYDPSGIDTVHFVPDIFP